MRKLLFSLIATSAIFQLYGQIENRTNINSASLDYLIRKVQTNQTTQTPDSGSESLPTFEFTWTINQMTTLEDLARLKRKAATRLGIMVSYRQIEFDSAGLYSITIEAATKKERYPSVTRKIKIDDDFGLHAIKYENRHYFFVGNRANWPEQLHNFIARR